MENESFVMHKNFLEGIPEEEQFKWFKTICDFAFNGTVPVFTNWLEDKIWKNIQDRIESDREAYELKKERNRQKVNKWRQEHGIAPKEDVMVTEVTEVTEGYSGLQAVTLDTPRISDSEFKSEFKSESVFKSNSEFKSDSISVFDYVSDSVSDSISDIERGDSKESAPSKKRFIKPTLDEVTEYVSEKRYTFSPVAFYNFYESNGWKVGKNQMKDWHAACVTWESREKNNSGAIGNDEHIQKYEWDNSLLEGVKNDIT